MLALYRTKDANAIEILDTKKRAPYLPNLQTGQNAYHRVIVKFRSYVFVSYGVYAVVLHSRFIVSPVRLLACYYFFIFKNIRRFHHRRRYVCLLAFVLCSYVLNTRVSHVHFVGIVHLNNFDSVRTHSLGWGGD